MRGHLRGVSVAAVVVVALLSVSACHGSGDDSHALDGTAWRLAGWTVSSLDAHNFAITAKFSGGKISGDSGVNAYGGSYTAGPGDAFSVGRLSVGGVGGIGPDKRAEDVYLSLLGEARSFSRNGDLLTLFDQHGNESLTFRAAGR